MYEQACDGRWDLFDALIDNPGSRYTGALVTEALDLCGRCPIRETCWAANADEAWLQVIGDVVKARRKRGAA